MKNELRSSMSTQGRRMAGARALHGRCKSIMGGKWNEKGNDG